MREQRDPPARRHRGARSTTQPTDTDGTTVDSSATSSWTCLPCVEWVLEAAPDVPAHLVSTLLGVARHARPDGRDAHPGVDRLCGYTRKSVRQVKADLADLLCLGLLRRPHDQSAADRYPGDRRPTVYDLEYAPLRPHGPRPDRRHAADRMSSTARRAAHDMRSTTPRESNGVQYSVERGAVQRHHGVRSTAPKESLRRRQEEDSSLREESLGVAKRSNESIDSNFNEFWAAYPRRDGKLKARTAYAKALAGDRRAGHEPVAPEMILAAARRYADHRQGENRKYTLLPTSWLNERRWEDELPPRQVPAPQLSPRSQRVAEAAALAARYRAEEQAAEHTNGWKPLALPPGGTP